MDGVQCALPAGVFRSVAQRRHVVVQVPCDVRRKQHHGDCGGQHHLGPRPAPARVDPRRQRQPRQRKQHRVFRPHSRRKRHAGQCRAPAPRRAQPCQQEQRQRHDQRRIGGNKQAADRDPRQRGIGDAGQRARPRPGDRLPQRHHRHRRGAVRQRPRQPRDPRRVRAGRRVRQPDQPAHQRRLGPCPGGQFLTPQPVLRLVHVKLHVRQRQQGQPPRGQRGNGGPGEALDPTISPGGRHGSATGSAGRSRFPAPARR